MGLDVRKPVFGVCEQLRCRPASAATQSDQRLVIRFFESIISELFFVVVALFSPSILCVGGLGGPSPCHTLQTTIFFINKTNVLYINRLFAYCKGGN